MTDPGARHNLGVAILEPVHIAFAGSVGYYCAGMIDRPTVEIEGSAGWGLAESMLDGTVIVHGNAGNGAAAAIRGGTVVIEGDAAARAAVSIKGGLVVVGGSCGYMAGFMGQKGTLIVCGDAGEAFADSMYETVCYVGGEIAEPGQRRRGRGARRRGRRLAGVHPRQVPADRTLPAPGRARSRRSSPDASCGTSTSASGPPGARPSKPMS